MSNAPVLEGPRFELVLGEESYPPMLAQIPNPPEHIYGIGNPVALQPGVAIIGARRATPYGLTCTERFATHAARRGLTIVAGGARGCDLTAHETAVKMEVPTVVVFGSGADVVYPKQGAATFQSAVDAGGAVISENPWDTPPLPAYFPQRNRIIAGLAVLLVIAEAGLPSGTFSTADAALAQGKDVAVVPGAITSPTSAGSNRLLVQGAIPLVDEETFDDALLAAWERYPVSMVQGAVDTGGTLDAQIIANDEVLAALAAEAFHPAELALHFDMSPSQLSARLSYYEMQGLVERGRDGRYQLRAHLRT